MQYTLNTGEIVRLSLSFGALYDLRERNAAQYDAYMDVMRRMDGGADKVDLIFDPLTVIYTAYLCAYKGDGALGFRDFVDLANPRIAKNAQIMKELIMPKNSTASVAPLKKEQGATEA